MAGDWIKVARDLRSHWVWDDADVLRAWIDLLMEANWKEGKRMVSGTLYELNRGEILCSERWLATRWGWSKGKVSRFIKRLKDDAMVTIKRTGKLTIITVSKYGTYQDVMPLQREPTDQLRVIHEPVTAQSRVNGGSVTDHYKEGKEQKEVLTLNARETDEPSMEPSQSEGALALGEPPIDLASAIEIAQTIMVSEEVTTAWWHKRDAIGWVHPTSGAPIRRWQSDLKAFDGAYRENQRTNGRGKKTDQERTGLRPESIKVNDL